MSKRITRILLIGFVILSVGIVFTGCLPMTGTEGTTATETTADQAADGEQATGLAGIFSNWGTWIWLVVLGAAFYFLLIRPQRQRTKKAKELMDNLQRGDEVVTIGGFHGRTFAESYSCSL